MSEEKEKLSYRNIIILIVAFIIVSMFFFGGFGLRGDYAFMYDRFFCPMRESMIRYHSLIGWNSYLAGGQVGLTVEQPIFEFVYFFYMLFNDPNIAATLGTWIYALFGIIGIYLLVFKLTKDNKVAIISSIFFSLNIFFLSFFIGKTLNHFVPYAFLPWVFFLYLDIGKSIKKIILNSILIGFLLAIAFLVGGLSLLIWIIFIFPVFVFVDLFILGNRKVPFSFKIKKLVLVILIANLAFAGFSAVKLYPTTKFIEKTNRDTGWDVQTFVGHNVDIKEFWTLNFNLERIGVNYLMRTGFVPLILIAAALPIGFRKKNFLKFFFIFVLGIIISANLFSVASLLRLIPVLNKTRSVFKFLAVYQFSVSVLLGLSLYYIFNALRKTKFKKYAKVLFALVLLLLLLELLYPVFKGTMTRESPQFLKSQLDKQVQLKYLANIDTERHRHHMLGKDWVVGGAGEQYFCKLGIESMDWLIGNAWVIDYTTYTLWASSNLEQGAKLWGILNTKYVTAQDPNVISPVYTKAIFDYKNETDYFVPGLKLIKRFPSCEECAPDITLLYENTRFLPRVFLVNKSILIVGEKDELYNLYAFMLLNNNFEPRTTVLIGKGSIKDEDLSKYSAIILGQQITQEEVQKLRQFKDSGGEIFPDIFVNENNINVEKLDILLQKWNKEASDIKEITEEYYSPNHRIYKVEENLKGFLVISESFYTYRDEWLVELNSENKEIYSADFVVSAVYLDNEQGKLEFRYNPVYFRIGGIISLVTLFAAIFLFIFLRKKFK